MVLPPVDISRFDLRVARLEHVFEHPLDDNNFYINNIIYYGKDVNSYDMEFKLAINDVAQYYSDKAMDDRLVVVLCNPKPEERGGMAVRAKMLCAAAQNRLELLLPPPGSEEGDIVTVDGYPPAPEKPFLLPVENAFASIAPEIRVNESKQVVYRGIPLKVEGKGPITTDILSDCPVTFE